MDILQEKFQVVNPTEKNDDGQNGWKSADSARQRPAISNARLNQNPPGMDITNQKNTEQNPIPMVMSGETDVSADWNEGALKKGFTKRECRATDDEYSNAHNDAFYDEIKVDGSVGFAERNNVLDRM